MGKLVTDDYFGKVPVDRLKIKNGVIFLNADANYKTSNASDRVLAATKELLELMQRKRLLK